MSGSFVAFVTRRACVALAFVAVVSASAFTLARLAPGDATTELFARGADRATIAHERARLGLDRPFVSEFSAWIGGIARFDLGTSYRFDRPVRDLIVERAPNTARLASFALLIATLVGLPLGLLTGAHPRGLISLVTTPVSLALIACPPIVVVLGLLLVAAVTGWLSTSAGHLLVPTLALALPLAALLERVQSQATRDALASPDLIAAAARGVSPWRLLWIHAARQSLRPVLGIYGIAIGTLFGGSFIVEIVTTWPGLGKLMYDALVGRDVYLVAGCAMAAAVCIAAGNLMADVLRALADPRVQEHL